MRAARVPDDTGAGIDGKRLHAGLEMRISNGRQNNPFPPILGNLMKLSSM